MLGAVTGTGTVAQAILKIGALPDSKAYDGTTAASPGVAPVYRGLAQGDRLTGLIQRFDGAAVGDHATLVAGYALDDGNGGNNYQVVLATGKGSITTPPR